MRTRRLDKRRDEKMADSDKSDARTSVVDVDALSHKELKRKLEELKLFVKGSKAVLAERLRQALSGNAKDATDAKESDVLLPTRKKKKSQGWKTLTGYG